MNKPLMKDAVEYFYNDKNWTPIWSEGQTGLNIEKLNGVSCLRLGMNDHNINDYVHKDYDTLLYFAGASRIGDIHQTLQQSYLGYEEIKNLIRHHWEEDL